MVILNVDGLRLLRLEDGVGFYQSRDESAFVVVARDEVDHTCLAMYQFEDEAHFEVIIREYDLFETFGL